MSEEMNRRERLRISNRNIDIGLVGMFLSIFLISGCLYWVVHTFGFIISGGILASLSVMLWAIFSLIWVGYWWNKK